MRTLTEEQCNIVNYTGSAYVDAGPGCAKTSTMIYDVLERLKDDVMPQNIQILAFNTAIVDDIKMKPKIKGVKVSTFHAFSSHLVERYDGISFDNKLYNNDTSKIDFSSSMKYRENPTLLKTANRHAKKRYQEFEDYMNKEKLYDFSYFIIRAVDILKADDGYRNKIQKKIEYLYCDECQDITEKISELISLLVGPQTRLLMFGDSDQMILEWNGITSMSNVDFLIDKFSLKKFKLTQSFRLPVEIAECANALINHNHGQHKTLVGNKSRKGIIKNLVFNDESNEIAFLENKIKRINDKGLDLKEIVILASENKLVDFYKNKFPDVKVLTIHKVKGLEFDTVFLVGAEEGIMPKKVGKHFSKFNDVSYDEDEEIGRRLFYQAMTRSSHRFIVCSCVNYYRTVYKGCQMGDVSRYVAEAVMEVKNKIGTADTNKK